MTAILCLIFFLSGASALIFELLWFQLAGLTFGNSVWATSLVLASFMAGLALGSALVAFKGHKIKSPIRFYALLEIIIGIAGFLLVVIFPNLTEMFVPVYRALLDHFFFLNSFKAIFAFCLMLVPACAMGATLPILVKALYRHSNREEPGGFGRVLGILYGWNTFGAMAGVLIGELFLVEWLGIRGAGLLAAGLNFIAAGTAVWIYKKKKKEPTEHTEATVPMEKTAARPSISFKINRLLSAGFLSGFTLLALEVLWFRFMLLFFSATSWNFAVMLAMVLLGISLGGMFASKWFRVRPDADRSLIPVLAFNGILIVLLYTNFGTIHNIIKAQGDTIQVVSLSLFLIFPVSFLSGIIFTLLGRALFKEMGSETKATGLLTLANTVGGAVGSLMAGFVFIAYIGIEKSFFLLTICYGLIVLLVLQKDQFTRIKKKRFLLALVPAAYLISLLLFPFGFMDVHYLKIPFERYSENGEKRMSVREGVVETLQYLQKDLLGQPHYHRLVTNSHTMSGTWMSARRYMKLFVYWPVAVHPGMKNALLICYGCGMTAKAMTDTKGFENIEIVDISREIVEESRVVFPDPKENPINDPRVKVHIEDGRFFLLTRQRQFDLITAEPPPPKSRGIVNLYTQEYFQLIHDRLADGGIVTYWLPVYQLGVHETKAILKGFCDVFQENSLWAGSGLEWMMVGIKNPKKHAAEALFGRQWQDPIVGPEMRTLGFENPEQFGAFFIADGQRLRQWVSGAMPLVDNYPKRISSHIGCPPEDIETYIDFMNHAETKTNFINSKGIRNIWPETLHKNTAKRFASAHIINEILTPQKVWHRYKDITYLHQCIHDPLLAGYIPWVLGSDHDARKIIDAASKEGPGKPVEGPGTYIHLASAALWQRHYLPAEHYLYRAVDYLSRGDRLDEFSSFNYCTLRMYLLFIAGEKERARQVGREYLDVLERKQGKASRDNVSTQFENYLQWLEQTL